MAKKRFRVEQVTPEQKAQIDDLLRSFSPYESNLLDALESGKKEDIDNLLNSVPGRFVGGEQDKVRSKIEALSGGLKSREDALKSYVDSQKDVPNLTDQELAGRVDALTEIGKIPGKTTSKAQNLKDYFFAQLDEKLARGGRPLRNEVVKQLVDYAIPALQQGNYNPQHIVDTIVSNIGSGRKGDNIDYARAVANDIPIDYTREIQSGQYNDTTESPKDNSADIKTAQDIIADRAFKSKANADIMSFFESVPGELSKSREAVFDPQRKRAKDYIQEVYAPGVRERLASRGLQDSGEVASAITSKYADLFGSINDAEAEQLMSDVNFFSQQGYDKTFSDLVNAGADVRATIGSERQKLRTQQITDFGKKQADIESRFNFDLFRDQAKSAYDTYQKQVMDKNAAKKSQDEADLIGDVAKTGTTVAIASML